MVGGGEARGVVALWISCLGMPRETSRRFIWQRGTGRVLGPWRMFRPGVLPLRECLPRWFVIRAEAFGKLPIEMLRQTCISGASLFPPSLQILQDSFICTWSMSFRYTRLIPTFCATRSDSHLRAYSSSRRSPAGLSRSALASALAVSVFLAAYG